MQIPQKSTSTILFGGEMRIIDFFFNLIWNYLQPNILFILILKKITQNKETISLFLDFFVAIGTFGAVIVALFQEDIKSSKLFGPNLVLKLIEPSKRLLNYPGGSTINTFVCYLSINNIGRISAKNVRCVISAIGDKDNIFTYYPPKFLPWVIPLQNYSIEEQFITNISPNETRLIPIIYTQEDVAEKVFIVGNKMSLQIISDTSRPGINQFSANEDVYINEFYIKLGIFSDNSKSSEVTIDVFFENIDDYQTLKIVNMKNI